MKNIALSAFLAIGLTACALTQGQTAQQNGVLTNMAAVYQDIESAKVVTISAFSLTPNGRMARELIGAAQRGATVAVALDGKAFGEAKAENDLMDPVFRKNGVHVHYSVGPSHLKALVTDGQRTYLSDRNWTSTGQDEIVILDPYAGDRVLVERAMLGIGGENDHLWLVKRNAIHAEAAMLATRTANHLDVQTESFGEGTEVYNVIVQRAHQGDHVRLLVSNTEYNHFQKEQDTVSELQRMGVDVRLSPTNEKIAIEGQRSWVGSANLTRGLPEQIDFGFLFNDSQITSQLQQEFDKNWNRSSRA